MKKILAIFCLFIVVNSNAQFTFISPGVEFVLQNCGLDTGPADGKAVTKKILFN